MPSDSAHAARLSVAVTKADGTVSRWGPDEWDAANIPQSMRFGTSVPGGFKDATITLPRRIDLDYPDLNLFDTVTILGPGGKVAWEGRVVQLPREHGDQYSIQVGCVGWSSHLTDDPSFTEVYVDRDLSHWGPASVARRLALSGSFSLADPEVTPDATTQAPSLKTGFKDTWLLATKPLAEAFLDLGPGITLGSVYYAWKKDANVINADANWNWYVGGSDTDTLSAFDLTANLRAAGPGTGTYTPSTTGRRFAFIQHYYNTGPAGNANTDYGLYWTCLAVYGSHGLTKQGTEDATNAKGFYASDIIRHAVSNAAPLLSAELSTAGGKIDATGFVIPQAEFRDPTTAKDVIEKVNAYHLWEWFVWENRVFHYRAPDPSRLCWEARLSEGARLNLEGDQADDIYNGVVVSYTAPDGSKKSVGPVGSGCDSTDSALQDTTATNPVNAHGIPRRWAKLDITPVTTLAGATQLGTVWLAEHAAPQRRGTLTLTGTCRHPTAGDVPGWNVRAGDYIRIADHPADVPRRIIETSWDHQASQLTCTLDNTVFKLEAIMERIGIALTGVL